jgi:hypothetical protein
MLVPKLKRNIRILVAFYSYFWIPSVVINLLFAMAYLRDGYQAVIPAFWTKLLLNAITVYVTHTFRNKEFYYYRNLGFANTVLWTGAFIIDFLLFFFSIFILHFFR